MLYLVFLRQLQLGQFVQMWFYSFFIFGPIQEMGNVISTYRETEVSLNNLKNIFDMPIEPRPVNPLPLGPLDHIEFDNLTFQHQTASTNALDGISFTADMGETIAFVGPSGSGKTTLVKLLVGLYRPKTGIIRYDGKSINEIDLDQLRSRIGMVSQDTQLFSGTIRDNMLFVNPATDEECLDMLNKAACHTAARPDKGARDRDRRRRRESVRRREAAALDCSRLAASSKLLVFDEATSSLWILLTEEEISVTIRDVSMRKDLIAILIAHRLSTVFHADRIYVLERGRSSNPPVTMNFAKEVCTTPCGAGESARNPAPPSPDSWRTGPPQSRIDDAPPRIN